jgi:hemolysin activation/secretion protein
VHLIGAAGTVTPIHYLVWSGLYSFSAQYTRFEATGSLGVNFAIRNVGSRDSDFEFNRYGAQSDFAYLRGADTLRWRFWRDWSVRLKFSYQYSQSPLVNNEQFALGGTDTVRGYYVSEALVDSATAESVELPTPTVNLRFLNAELFAFYDAAQGGLELPLASQISHFEFASTGLGIHALRIPNPNFDGALEWAHVLDNGPRTQRGDNRIKFQMKYSY